MTLQHRALGDPPRAVVVQLEPGQALWCLSRRVLFATPTVAVGSRFNRPSGSDTLFARAVDAGRRLAGGDSPRVRWARAEGGPGLVGLADPLGGEVVALELTGGAGWLVRGERLLAAESTVTSAAGSSPATLDRVAGTGTVLVSAVGEIVEVDPGRLGGRLLVAGDRLLGHEATVVATDDGGGVLALTGPGRVLLDTVAGALATEDDRPADRPSAFWGEELGMDLLAKAKEAAEKAAAMAQGGLAQGQSKVEELQAQRRGGDLVRALGAAYWEEQRQGGDHEAVVRALAALDAHVAAHGPVTSPAPEGYAPPPPPTGTATPAPAPGPVPPPPGPVPPPPPHGATLGDL